MGSVILESFLAMEGERERDMVLKWKTTDYLFFYIVSYAKGKQSTLKTLSSVTNLVVISLSLALPFPLPLSRFIFCK
jgi:hypothetical protein